MKVKGITKNNKTEKFEVKNFKELKNKAKSGEYEHLTVTRRSGDQEEYLVDKGKLVLL